MPYKDKAKLREYQARWIAERRRAYFEGKTCVKCGATQDLELDHIDPALKVSHLIWSWSEERRLVELAKCQVLCQDCHLEKTVAEKIAAVLPVDGMHGTCSGYSKFKCRCELCKAWKREAHARETLRRR